MGAVSVLPRRIKKTMCAEVSFGCRLQSSSGPQTLWGEVEGRTAAVRGSLAENLAWLPSLTLNCLGPEWLFDLLSLQEAGCENALGCPATSLPALTPVSVFLLHRVEGAGRHQRTYAAPGT